MIFIRIFKTSASSDVSFFLFYWSIFIWNCLCYSPIWGRLLYLAQLLTYGSVQLKILLKASRPTVFSRKSCDNYAANLITITFRLKYSVKKTNITYIRQPTTSSNTPGVFFIAHRSSLIHFRIMTSVFQVTALLKLAAVGYSQYST